MASIEICCKPLLFNICLAALAPDNPVRVSTCDYLLKFPFILNCAQMETPNAKNNR